MTPKSKQTRTESDLLGEIEVPTEALHGAWTQRAVLNFPTGNQRTIGSLPTLIEGLMAIKQAAARVNARNGFLPQEKANAIVDAAKSVLSEPHFDQFPVHALHGGGGTSANMNANEVVANLAEERLGGTRGHYRIIHPNDHVSLHQSTNDVYLTACHIAVLLHWPALETALDRLYETFDKRADELRDQRRIGRTCLQDAVDITFGDLLGGYASFVKRACVRVREAVDQLHSVNLGGTIVGRPEDVPEPYFHQIVAELAEVTGDVKFRRAENLFDAAQNPDDIAAVASQLDGLARGLIKIGQDFRWMGSGPEAGLQEVELPPMQPGSTCMPGKVNPVIPEFLIQAGFQVIGCNAASQAALEHGELDINIWESTFVFNILEAMEMLTTAVTQFEERCIRGFVVNEERNSRNADSIIALLRRLTLRYGYSKISDVCRESYQDPDRLRELLRKRGYV